MPTEMRPGCVLRYGPSCCWSREGYIPQPPTETSWNVLSSPPSPHTTTPRELPTFCSRKSFKQTHSRAPFSAASLLVFLFCNHINTTGLLAAISPILIQSGFVSLRPSALCQSNPSQLIHTCCIRFCLHPPIFLVLLSSSSTGVDFVCQPSTTSNSPPPNSIKTQPPQPFRVPSYAK